MWSWSGILGIFRAWVGGDPVVDHGVGSCVMIVRHLDPGGRTRASDGWLECLNGAGLRSGVSTCSMIHHPSQTRGVGSSKLFVSWC